MDAAPTPVLELVEVLHQEIAHLQSLARVAAEEQGALRRLAVPAFETVNQQRLQTLELLHVLETRRAAILADLARQWGVDEHAVTLSMVIDRVGREVSRTLLGQQREMDRLVDAVRQLMAVNRLAMSKLVDFIQQTLASARPASGPDAGYSESGTRIAARASGRVLAQQG